jgi:PAS domain S-box-containing protein
VFEDHRAAEETLAGVRDSTGAAYLVAEDAAGRILAAIALDRARAADYRQLDSALGAGDRDYRAGAPILHAGAQIGTLYVGTSLEPVRAQVRTMRRTIWAFATALFLLGTAITLGLGSLVTRPLAAIAETARGIVRGERGRRAPVTSKDEVGELALAINQMLDSLAQARVNLESLNRDLESRVSERTAALEQENAERRRSEDELGHANERFALAAAAVEGAIYDWDIDSNRMKWSDGLCRVFGYSTAETVGDLAWWKARVDPADLPRVEQQLDQDVAAGRDFLCEYRFRCQTGEFLSVLDRGRVLRDSDGRAVRMVGVLENISELRRLEDQFLHAQRMDAVGRLAGGIAHDFNNLLTTILGYCAILLDEAAVDAHSREAVLEIRAAGERAANLTRQLLTFSRKDDRKLQVLDVNQALLELEKMLRRMIGEDVELVTRLSPQPLRVRIDRTQFEQVLLNIAINARDAMPDGGTLEVATSERVLDETFVRTHLGAKPGRYVLLELRDDGCGMPGDVVNRIFEPFYTTKDVGRGTGLGMSVVYGVVKQAGGYVWVESTLGKGTTVSVYLPWSEALVPKPAEAPRPPVATGRGRILVAEDEPALRGMIRRLLETRGYEVALAGDGEEALRIAARDAVGFDLLLSDVVMPGINGYVLMNRLRSANPNLKVILMSGYNEEKVMEVRDLAPGTAFLSKPFPLDQLLRTLRELLDHSTSRVANLPAGDLDDRG